MTNFHYNKLSFLWFDSSYYNTIVAACQYTAWCKNMPWRQGDKVTWRPRGLPLHFVEENGIDMWHPGSCEDCHCSSWRRMEHGHRVSDQMFQTCTVLSHEPE